MNLSMLVLLYCTSSISLFLTSLFNESGYPDTQDCKISVQQQQQQYYTTLEVLHSFQGKATKCRRLIIWHYSLQSKLLQTIRAVSLRLEHLR